MIRIEATFLTVRFKAGGRAVDLEGPSVFQGGGGAKFEIKHKSRCLERISLLIGGAKHVDREGQGPGKLFTIVSYTTAS